MGVGMGLTTPPRKNQTVQKPHNGWRLDVGRRSRKRNMDKNMKLATWNVREGRRSRGRHRHRWKNDVKDDLRKLGAKQWRTKELEREE
jgi:hypothetical protein